MSDRPNPWSAHLRRRLLGGGQRASGAVEQIVARLMMPIKRRGFPYTAPSRPRHVVVPDEAPALGADYDTDWARTPLASSVRSAITAGPLRVAIRFMADPEILGHDRLADLTILEEPPPVIFAPNHHSHLDTGLMIRSVPRCWRSDLVVAAAADYFFDARWKAVLSAMSLNAIPIDREIGGRRSAELIRDLIADGYSLVIYPEGGRSPDGWGQEFKGGAAYLSARTGAPVIPVYIDGTGAIFGKGMTRPRRGRTRVIFGEPLLPIEGESTRRFNTRIEQAVAMLADESVNDFWTARLRHHRGATPSLAGPDVQGWRRQWVLSEHRRRGVAGQRRHQRRTWPDLG
jgi:1-acyl-sn-glycerol-3-phosphate acyltransferase